MSEFKSIGTLPENSIIFLQNQGEEILKLCQNGDILVKSKLIENDKEVVIALREILYPNINKNRIYDEMLEKLIECARFLQSVQAPATSALFLRKEVESLIKKATE